MKTMKFFPVWFWLISLLVTSALLEIDSPNNFLEVITAILFTYTVVGVGYYLGKMEGEEDG